MKKLPLISVIIPVYNGEKTIIRCINSVLKQRDVNIEILVVDNLSDDKSVPLVNLLNDDRIKILKCDKKGVSFARNIGIQHATGEYICFLDCDDYYENNALLKLVSFCEHTQCAFAFGNYKRLTNGGALTNIQLPRSVTRKQMFRRNYIPILTVMIKSDLLKNFRFKNVRHEDYLMWMDVLTLVDRALNCQCTIAVYDDTIEGISSNKLKSALWHYNLLRCELEMNKALAAYFTLTKLCLTLYERLRSK